MFGKKNSKVPAIVTEWENKWYHNGDFRNSLRRRVQEAKWAALPLEVLLEDSAEYRSVLKEVEEAKKKLRNAIAFYDADCFEFMKWRRLHHDELPDNYRAYPAPAGSIDVIRNELCRIEKHGYDLIKK